MVKTGVIRSVDQPTDWCSGIVTVSKPDGRVHVCTDFTRLNQSVRRKRHMLPSIEHLLADVQGATYFSKLDANSGFHQVPLDSECQLLTTFITPSSLLLQPTTFRHFLGTGTLSETHGVSAQRLARASSA